MSAPRAPPGAGGGAGSGHGAGSRGCHWPGRETTTAALEGSHGGGRARCASWWSPRRGRLASFLGLSLGAAWVGATAGAEASQMSLDLSIGEPSRRVLARVTDHWGGTVLVSRYVRSALEVKREAHTDSSTVAMPTRRLK